MSNVQGLCPDCGGSVTVPLPVEPLFNREEVCALVPVKLSTLRKLCWIHKPRLSPARYIGPPRKAKRMFTAADVRFLRSVRIRDRQ